MVALARGVEVVWEQPGSSVMVEFPYLKIACDYGAADFLGPRAVVLTLVVTHRSVDLFIYHFQVASAE